VTGKSVVVLDYGSGNLRSAQRALERVGASVEVTADAGAASAADGLVVPGAVTRLDAPVVPHMGWNVVNPGPGSALFKGLDANARFYFVHSYAAQRWEGSPGAVLTWATHQVPFLAAVEDGPLAATQFHPEKSGDAGAAVLSNWVEGL
jgi:imidazoleglycerol phosphate synthase glutamine amidotransferase subunit HisH